MRWILLATLLLSGCGGAHYAPPPESMESVFQRGMQRAIDREQDRMWDRALGRRDRQKTCTTITDDNGAVNLLCY